MDPWLEYSLNQISPNVHTMAMLGLLLILLCINLFRLRSRRRDRKEGLGVTDYIIILFGLIFVLLSLVPLCITFLYWAWIGGSTNVVLYLEYFSNEIFMISSKVAFFLLMSYVVYLLVLWKTWHSILDKKYGDYTIRKKIIQKILKLKVKKDIMRFAQDWVVRSYDFAFFSILLVLLSIFVPELKTYFKNLVLLSIEGLLGQMFSDVNLDVSNLAIVFFTLVLVIIEYVRYRQEFSTPVITVSLENMKNVESAILLVFRVNLLNTSRIAYKVKGKLFTFGGNSIDIGFLEENPIVHILQETNRGGETLKRVKKIYELIIPPGDGQDRYVGVMVGRQGESRYTFLLFSFEVERPGFKVWGLLLEKLLLADWKETVDHLFALDHKKKRVHLVLKL